MTLTDQETAGGLPHSTEGLFTSLLDGLLADKPLRAAFYSDRFLPLDDFTEKHVPVIRAYAKETAIPIGQESAAWLAKRVWMALYFQ
tara:strand:+ start:310 stop:570 length:261 start_codon:yes stop_codon:yes gene_type:complete